MEFISPMSCKSSGYEGSHRFLLHLLQNTPYKENGITMFWDKEAIPTARFYDVDHNLLGSRVFDYGTEKEDIEDYFMDFGYFNSVRTESVYDYCQRKNIPLPSGFPPMNEGHDEL
eukprot:CAMPEP_0201491766 /NCGR_PEP_ID=MMETSP0151_2-20130828/31120_1 /ASSEMBLY_ACC=CAM_ASM_000257 /TAXON_ID=200890 /ORGANISM="Paramoeba atlantica, Strain 621/1 / CCAP 1560/9" /LENGTH=114 /DNA_ID=CAMNT_0047878281 /DNA_START=120 /DNA_END=464 /DNA_ORIENTATION=+